jgi:hypothetical protein
MGGEKRFGQGNPEGKRPLEKPRRSKEDNIKMDLKGVGWGHGLDCSGSVQGQVAGCCKCSNESPNSIKYEECD